MHLKTTSSTAVPRSHICEVSLSEDGKTSAAAAASGLRAGAVGCHILDGFRGCRLRKAGSQTLETGPTCDSDVDDSRREISATHVVRNDQKAR